MIRVYKYGLLPPTLNEPLVREQMRSAHRYRNQLIEIERARRAAVRAIYAAHPTLAALVADAKASRILLDEARDIIKRNRQKTRARCESELDRQRAKLARVQRRATTQALATARRELRPVIEAELKIIEDRAGELRRGARAICKTYWGTYLGIEAADDASRKMPLYDGDEPNDPRFLRWEGEGSVGVQIQSSKHLFTYALDGNDSRCRVISLDRTERENRLSGRGLRSHARKKLMLRVSSEGRAPVWAEWPMIQHRPFPAGSCIKWVKVHCRLTGTREHWSVDFTIEAPDSLPAHGQGVVGIDIGWRQINDNNASTRNDAPRTSHADASSIGRLGPTERRQERGGQRLKAETELRVCAWASEDGRDMGDLRLTSHEISQLTKASSLRAIRDKNFDHVRTHLRQMLDSIKTPAWLSQACLHMMKWRSQAKLSSIVWKWRKERFVGDDEAFMLANAWRKQDRHLYQWESEQRMRALLMRREKYRTFAVSLASKYETLVLEDRIDESTKKMDLRPLARRDEPEERKELHEAARSQRFLAATSELRLALIHAFESRRGHVNYAACRDSTAACHECGLIQHWDHNELEHTCENRECNATWDQDDNAAQNLCERYRQGGDGGGARKSKSVKREGKFQRRAREKLEREQNDASSREVSGNAAE
jgi:hypothetical protein